MCTVVVLVRPGYSWPLMLAANRDEQLARAWDPPSEYWPDYPGVVAGRDRSGGGTWMGMNRHGVVAAVLNRQGSLGPAPGKLSRGELPLRALARPSAIAAAEALSALDAALWRSFNLVLADRTGAIFLRGLGAGQMEWQHLAPGCHMVTAHDVDDPESPRVARHLHRFAAAIPATPAPQPTSSTRVPAATLAAMIARSGRKGAAGALTGRGTRPRPGQAPGHRAGSCRARTGPTARRS